MRLVICVCGFFALLVLGAGAQTVDATHLGDSINLSGKWRFQAGDDPRWAQPDFDDSKWPLVSIVKPPPARWPRKDVGYFWIRLHVNLPQGHGPLALLANYSANPYIIYVNGKAVGQFGDFPPHERMLRPLPRKFTIPAAAIPANSAVIGIRYWISPRLRPPWYIIPGERGLVLGTERAVDDEFKVRQSSVLYDWVPDYTLRFLSVLLGAGLLILFRLKPENPEYLWLALYAFALTVGTIAAGYISLRPATLQATSYLDLGWSVASQVFLLEFTFAFIQRRMPVWLRVYQISQLFELVAAALFYAGWMGEPAANLTLLLWNLPYAFILPAAVLWHCLRGHKEAALLVAPMFLINFNDMLNTLSWVLFELKLRNTTAPFIPGFHIGVVTVYIGHIEGLLFLLSIGGLLLYRFHKTSRDEARAHAELEAARSMQEVLLPKQSSGVPGFAIESAYIPAQEVGGDFFQIFPGADGSLFVVIGDVSGKGVKAALMVSLIVGLLQRTIDGTREPARVLSDLNRHLIGHTAGGFATCCCALLSPDGAVRIANAGHLAPYCDGTELPVLGGLPLGVSADVAYEETDFRLRPGTRLVLLSDGVVEARSKSGELYGFERTRVVSIQPVKHIAEEAKRFGQEDDITVVGIERHPAFA
ncbi:MAG: SpoIIE family protein phosphatase [Acidobacteriaceae bacterium]|nr:SpoIIE family protein phosphatase [Acidobacteriaceae bacterium]